MTADDESGDKPRGGESGDKPRGGESGDKPRGGESGDKPAADDEPDEESGNDTSTSDSPTTHAGADCEFVDAAVDSFVATVTIDRPDARNALNARVRDELKTVFDVIADDDSVRVVVLTGSDDAKAFVAGADVTELRKRGTIEQRRVSTSRRIYETVDDLQKPVIARINGHALGGGLELALACDIRIAHERAKLGSPEINLGLIPGGGATQRLPRLVGEGKAMQLVLSGELVDATEAHDIGLVDIVHDDESFDDAAYELASSIAEKSPLAAEHAKRAIRAASRYDLDHGLAYELELFVDLFDSHDKNEGIDAFLEDRDPEWRGE